MSIFFKFIIPFIGLVFGFLLARLFRKRVIVHLGKEPLQNSLENIYKSAEIQRDLILQEARKTAEEQYKYTDKRQDEERNSILRTKMDFEKDLDYKEEEIDNLINEQKKKEEIFAEQEEKLRKKIEDINQLNQEKQYSVKLLQDQLEEKIGQGKQELFEVIMKELNQTYQLEMSRELIEKLESFKVESQKFAREKLESVYLRYQPQFVWPKGSFSVTVPSQELVQKHFYEGSPLANLLLEKTESSLSVLTLNNELPPLLKISGGLGVDKEIIRLTLEELIAKKVFNIGKAATILEKYRTQTEKLIERLGIAAAKTLGISSPKIHPEIIKLIGSLNYRTSHRQNQYFHSIEVATLAGMIACEIGLSPDIVRRAGLLHDIGKVLDYKIEQGHAVISGDYATRFGESETVVDTVLAHHDDKLVETPYAYILKAADALSGARPGARVDMEEGYNRRIDGISGVVNSFQDQGVTGSAIMHAGREVYVFVDPNKIKHNHIAGLAEEIAKRLEEGVEYPGHIRVTVIHRTEITAVA